MACASAAGELACLLAMSGRITGRLCRGSAAASAQMVLPLSLTVWLDAPMTVARVVWAGGAMGRACKRPFCRSDWANSKPTSSWGKAAVSDSIGGGS